MNLAAARSALIYREVLHLPLRQIDYRVQLEQGVRRATVCRLLAVSAVYKL